MKYRALRLTLVILAVSGITLLLRASLPTVATGTWGAAGSMAAARSGACTAVLSDGRLLISGGADANGPTATADLFSTTGSWSAAAKMSSPRSHQSCAVLQDGRVLVAGGTSSNGVITNSAELYDPSADSWTPTAFTNDARSGATASVLQDGRVLIAGGQGSGAALNTLEIYDPNSETFSNAGTLSTPRQDQAAAVLSDGRVLIVGGSSDGTSALKTTEIYDLQAGSASAGPAMSTARVRHTATTLLDGTVVVIGGSDYTNDLASAEVFDPVANTFSAAANLATARSKHSAFLLPNNNEVLVVGGQLAGSDLASAELYIPWLKVFQATGAMATARSDATGTALTSVDGRLLIAGGVSASAELYGFATVKTDASDYPPGTTVKITGSGWQPNETVTLTLVESPLIDTHGPFTTVTDNFGNISNSSFVTDSHDVSIRFYLTASGLQSQAQNTFTDAVKEYEASITPTLDTGGHASTAYSVKITNDPTSSNDIASATIAIPSGYTSVTTGAITTSPTGLNWTASVAAGVITISANTGSDHINAGQSVSLALTATAPCTDGSSVWTTATSGNFTLVGSQPAVTITGACTANHFSVTLPASVTAGTPLNFSVTALTASNAVATNYTGTAHFTNSDSQGVLPANYTFTTSDAGTHTFTATLKTAGSQSITATDTSVSSIAGSGSTTVNAAAANKLAFFQQPTDTNVGATITPAITVQVQDQFGNLVTTSSASTTLSIKTGTGTSGAVLACTTGLSHNASSGVATFPDCNINKAGTNYQLHAAATGVTAADSNTFTIISPISKLGFTTAPLTGNVNQCLGPITVQTQNSGGTGTNPSTAVQVDLSITSGGTGAFFSDSSCSAGITNVSIPTSANSADFFFKGTSAGSPVVQAADHAGALTSATQLQTVNKATVTPTVTANNKVYDATTLATQNACTLAGVSAGDAGNVICSASTLAFTDKNAGTGKTVNVSGISLSGTAAGNYQLSSTTTTTTANITARAITVTAAANTKNYDGTTSAAATPTITSGTLASGDTANSTEAYASKSVGTGLTLNPAGVVNDGNGGNNYAVTFVSSSNGVITARPITVTAAPNTKSYDGTTSASAVPTITSGSLVTGDTANFAEAYTTKNAGSGLTLVPTGSVSDGNSGNNYAVTLVNNTTGVIIARPITVTAATNSKSYDGTTSATATPTITSGSLVTGDTANFTEAYTAKNGGSGLTLVPTGSVSDGNSGNNYAVTLVNNTTGVIIARAITVTAASDTKAYDGTTSSTGTPTITSGTLATGDAASFTQVFDSKNAGARTLTASGSVNDGNSGNNYTITLKTANGTITARPITVTAATNTKTYDGTTAAAAIPMITSGTLVSGDTASFTEVYSSKNAGSGLTLIPSGAVSDGNGGNNYAVTLVNNTTGVINAATVTPSITASDKIYDGTTTATLTSQTLSGAISGDVVTLNVDAANFSDANAGNGKTVTATGLTLSGASAGNYQLLSATATTTANITPATPAVTVSGGTFIYDGMSHAASAVATGVGGVVVPGAFVFTYTPPGDTTVPVSAGNYTVSAAFTSSNTNYTGSVGAGAIVINQAQLSVTAADASRPYGQANPAFTGKLTGVVAGDGITATYASAATATTAAGVYGPGDPNAIVPTLVDPKNKLSNYNVTSTNGTLTITAIPLLVIANDKTRAFGAADPAFDAQYFSFVGGDTAASSLTGTLTCTPSNSGDTAGSYAIHCDGLSSNNYTLTFVDGTLTVTDPLAMIAVTPSAPSVSYSDSTTFAAQGTFASSAKRILANAGGAAYQLQDLSTIRTGAAEAEGQGKLYAIGGTVSGAVSDTVEVYDPTNDKWSAVHNLNNARTSARAASVAGKVYVFGGCSNVACTSLVATPEVYDSNSNIWAAVSSGGFTPRGSMAVGVIGGKIYVAGGNDNAGNALSVVEIYDPGTDTWSSAASLKTNLGPASGGVVNGTFYVVGISGGKAEVEAFNGTSWSTVNSGVQSLTDVAAAVLNNVVYVVDGVNIHAYDPASNTWTDKTSLNTARLQPEPVTIGNLIYVAGDAATSASDANALESFASDEAQWSSSDTTVSAIDQTGKASALKVGSATITATSIISPAISGSTALTVSPAKVTPAIAVSGKTYDGTTTATVTSCTVSPVVGNDDVACSVGTANFSDKNAGTGKTVTATGITLTGNSASNYMLSSTTATTAADIKARPLTVVATAVNRVYDGTISATVTLSDNRVIGDVFTDSYASATFPDKNVGDGKTVSVSGISISGTDASNYTFNATATTMANITPRTLTVTATGVNKVYDGTTTATVTLLTDKLTGDYVNVGYTGATFSDKTVANGKTVTVSGVSITGGADAGNYTLSGVTQVATAANITARTLTVTATGVNKVYDGTTTATVTLLTDKLTGDYVNVGYTSATFADKNVANGKTVTVSGVSITGGADAGNYTLNGITQVATNANITPRTLTVTATGVNKVYDGTTTATVTLSSDKLVGDYVNVGYTGATFSDKTVANGKAVTVTGVSITGGADAGNYTLSGVTQVATNANITPRTLTVTATGVNRVYDGTTTATVTLLTDKLAGDYVNVGYTGATFSDKTVANGKAVTVTGVSITGGADAGNYTLSGVTQVATTANITPRPLVVTATGVNKQYDGTTAATVTLADNRVTGDVFTDTYTSATFSDKNVADSKTVNVTGISISGTDSVNYTFNPTAATAANIAPRPLTVTATGVNKQYDGTTAATVTLADNRVTGDVFTDSYASATFTDKNVGNAKTVNVTGASITGTDAGNYTFNTTAATNANITCRPLTVTATGTNKQYDGTTATTVTLADNRVTGDVFADSYASATFSDKNVGNGKTVSVSGISISGIDSVNYTFNTTATTTANVTVRTLTVTATGVNKVYDGTTTATVTLLTDKLTGDYVNVGYTGATFSDKTVANGKAVTVSGVSITGGADAVNYTLNAVTQVATTANITPATLALTVTGASGAYSALPYTAACSVATGLVNGDSVTLTITYSSVTAPVIVGNYTATCTTSGNSNYQTATGQASITISPATTTTGVVSSVNPSTFMQLVTFTVTVTPQYAGTTPTGTVTFQDTYNGTTITLGTFTLTALSGGVATLSTSSLQDTFSNSITAVYSGDSNFVPSTSPAITQTVQPAPNVSLSPMFVSFGNQNANTTSKPATVTLTNIGDATLNISSNGISITGTDYTEFSQTNTCGSTVAAGKSCTITISFTPTYTGVASASLQIMDNDDDSTNAQQTVSLTGAGLSTISGGSLYTDALFATANGCGSILASGGSTVDSFSSVQGYASSHVLSGGNVGTNGNVTLNGSKSMIYGSAAVDTMLTGNCSKTSLTGITTSGGAQVTGGAVALNGPITYPAPPAPPAPPTTTQNISGSCGSIPGCTNTGTKTVSLAPGQYGNLSISGGTTAHVSMGSYNINSLSLTGNSILYVDSGPVVVNLAGASLNGGNPAMDASGGSIQNPSGKPSNLQFTYAGSRGLTLSGGSWSYATVYAPNALVNMSGGSDFFGSIIGSTVTASGGTAMHGDSSLADIQMGNTIWFTAVVNNVAGLPSSGNQVKLYLTNSSIQFTGGGVSYNVPVPNGVVTFNSASQSSGAKTTYDLTNSRWSTAVAKSGLTGNTFVAGVAFKVPSDFPTGIQNATWSASFSTDTQGVNLQWQWGAAVYGTALSAVCTSVDPNGACSASTYATASPINTNVLGVNAEDGSANANGTDPAGTPESYKASVIFGATGGGLTNYTGYRSSAAAVVPTIAPMSVSPSSLDFGTQNQGTTSAQMTAVLTNNDSNTHNFTGSGIQISGTNASDFTLVPNGPSTPNNCLAMSNLASGASCTLYATFTPADVGTRTAKIALNDDANNSPQTVYLSGTGQ